LSRGVEIATNLSIIVVALIGATVLVKNYLLGLSGPTVSGGPPTAAARNAPGTREMPKGPAEGTQISVPGVTWGESEETIVLALSNKCHFCTESAPFYQQLTREMAKRKGVRVVAVFPQETEVAKKYLDEIGVSIGEVKQVTLDTLGVRGTPTLVIVDKSGTVKQSWVGRLNAESESEVFSRVKA
jgi:hypothetical protein